MSLCCRLSTNDFVTWWFRAWLRRNETAVYSTKRCLAPPPATHGNVFVVRAVPDQIRKRQPRSRLTADAFSSGVLRVVGWLWERLAAIGGGAVVAAPVNVKLGSG